jgi:hypothetical protein
MKPVRALFIETAADRPLFSLQVDLSLPIFFRLSFRADTRQCQWRGSNDGSLPVRNQDYRYIGAYFVVYQACYHPPGI